MNHNRQSIRLQNYDYSQPGSYFITICLHDRWDHRFGNVRDEEMVLTDAGQIAADEWKKTPKIRDNISLDSWVIMPNHMHGIITIHPVGAHCMRPINESRTDEQLSPDCKSVESGRVRRDPTADSVEFGRVRRAPTVGDIVRGVKSAVTKRVRQLPGMHNIKLWQRNYWEHIIRDEKEHFMIREYIQNNPARWKADCFHNNVRSQNMRPNDNSQDGLRETPAEYTILENTKLNVRSHCMRPNNWMDIL